MLKAAMPTKEKLLAQKLFTRVNHASKSTEIENRVLASKAANQCLGLYDPVVASRRVEVYKQIGGSLVLDAAG